MIFEHFIKSLSALAEMLREISYTPIAISDPLSSYSQFQHSQSKVVKIGRMGAALVKGLSTRSTHRRPHRSGRHRICLPSCFSDRVLGFKRDGWVFAKREHKPDAGLKLLINAWVLRVGVRNTKAQIIGGIVRAMSRISWLLFAQPVFSNTFAI